MSRGLEEMESAISGNLSGGDAEASVGLRPGSGFSRRLKP